MLYIEDYSWLLQMALWNFSYFKNTAFELSILLQLPFEYVFAYSFWWCYSAQLPIGKLDIISLTMKEIQSRGNVGLCDQNTHMTGHLSFVYVSKIYFVLFSC